MVQCLEVKGITRFVQGGVVKTLRCTPEAKLDDPFLNAREHVAELLGISRFSLRYHGDTYIDHAWCVDISTAFHGAAVFGVARAVDVSREPSPTVWFRSAIAVITESNNIGASETASIKSDLLLDAATSIALFDIGDSFSRDGVGYTLYVPHHNGSVTLRFANPSSAPLTELESRIFRMAQSLGSQSGNENLTAFLSQWKTSSLR